MTTIRSNRIAVVDDDFRVREALTELLESDGHVVLPFASAQAFLGAAALSEVDCLILDVGMPVVSGLDLCSRVRAERPSIPVIFITARDRDTDLLRAEAGGHDGFFRKPFDGNALLNAITAAVSRREPPA
jgi:DNA-binding response OmpR family regulator